MEKSDKIILTAFAMYMVIMLPVSVPWGRFIATTGIDFSLGLLIVIAPWYLPMVGMLGCSLTKMWK